jgi:multidrug efflux system outer membrane protein
VSTGLPRRRPGRWASLPAQRAVVLGLGLLAGCAMPPPADDAAERREALAAVQGIDGDSRFEAGPGPAAAAGPQDGRWWTRLGDPTLAAWVQRALDHNLDLALAQARITEARAMLRAAQGARAPQLSAQAGLVAGNRNPSGRRVDPELALALAWDADLWGGGRWAERSAAAAWRRRTHEAQATRLATAAVTARAYLAWQSARVDRDALAAALGLLRDTARVVHVRVDAGLAPRLDSLRADGEIAAAEAALVQADTAVDDAAQALQLMAGQAPGIRGAPRPEAPAGLPPAPDDLPVALPLDLLRQRPDLRAAEEALLGADADLGVAQAARRPTLTLPGLLVLGTGAGGAVLSELTATVAASLAAPLLDGGRRAADEDAAASRVRQAELVYRQALLQALGEASAAYRASRDTGLALAAQRRAVDAADLAVAQARTLYDNGLTGFLDLLETQRSALGRRQTLQRRQADALRAVVAVYEALGLVDAAPAPG